MSKTSSASSLEIRLLGQVRLAVNGLPVEEHRWERRKAKSLVSVLALSPHHQLHREQLMEYLWRDLEPEAAANNLDKTIHMARRALEPGLESGSHSRFIVRNADQIVLRAPSDLWIDVDVFEQKAADALKGSNPTQYEAVLSLYAGDLLMEEPYEDWSWNRREQLRILYQHLLSRLAEIHEIENRYQASIEWRVSWDPLTVWC